MTVFVTNIWNHYTTTIGKPMADILGGENFRLALVSPTKEDPLFTRKAKMKWSFDLPNEKWLVPNPETSKDLECGEAIRLIETADVAVIGALYSCKRLFKAVRRRVSSGKLTFLTNERFIKEYVTFMDFFKPRTIYNWFYQHWLLAHKNVHYLPISHWGAHDARFLAGAKGRVWKWSYTPELSDVPVEKKQHNEFRIGWCGRMISWKHPDHILKAVALLPDEYRNRCSVSFVGDGDCKERLKSLTKELNLGNVVEFKPYMTVTEVAEWMSALDTYIFPSDIEEGWGVVLAEAMDKCCVPIACIEAGATLDLIDDGENGFVFEKGNLERVARKIMWLMDRPAEVKRMGLNAWKSLRERTPEECARRLARLVQGIKTDDMSQIPTSGICSACLLS